MSIAKLEVDLYRRGVGFNHLAPNRRATRKAYWDFRDALKEAGLVWEPSKYKALFITATLSGASAIHTPVLIIQDEHLVVDKGVLQEVTAIPSRMDGHPQTIIRYVS